MSDPVRHHDGVPTIEDFASGVGAPLVVNDETGVIYTEVSETVMPIALIVENRTSDPAAPEIGRLWLRTDL